MVQRGRVWREILPVSQNIDKEQQEVLTKVVDKRIVLREGLEVFGQHIQLEVHLGDGESTRSQLQQGSD